MRLSKWYVRVVYVLCVALLAGCSQTDTVEVGILTKEQALADYDYMWEVLEDNYPSFHVAERMYGVNKEQIKHLGRVSLNVYPAEEIPLTFFYDKIHDTLRHFQMVFHLSILPSSLYKGALLELKDHDIGRSFTQFITDWDKSTAVYEYIEEGSDTNQNYHNPYTGDNLSFQVIDDHTTVITIGSFHTFYEDDILTSDDILAQEIETLLQYYQQAAGYDNLIIDISNNSGGNNAYWESGIVLPNLTEEVVFNEVHLFKAGQENVKYLETLGFQLEDMDKVDESEMIQSLPHINMVDMEGLDYVFNIEKTLVPETDQKAFAGDIYVLIDRPVYSSSESFAQFCKQTGFATLVGRNSIGDGGSVNPLFVSLPESGLIVQYSSLYTLNEDGSSNSEFGTTPDYLSADGETPLETALRVIEMRRGD